MISQINESRNMILHLEYNIWYHLGPNQTKQCTPKKIHRYTQSIFHKEFNEFVARK